MTDWKQVEEINRQIQDLAWRSIWTNDLDVIRSVSERIEYLTKKKSSTLNTKPQFPTIRTSLKKFKILFIKKLKTKTTPENFLKKEV